MHEGHVNRLIEELAEALRATRWRTVTVALRNDGGHEIEMRTRAQETTDAQ